MLVALLASSPPRPTRRRMLGTRSRLSAVLTIGCLVSLVLRHGVRYGLGGILKTDPTNKIRQLPDEADGAPTRHYQTTHCASCHQIFTSKVAALVFIKPRFNPSLIVFLVESFFKAF
eukprot:GHVT01078426.1.p1 GENE.GHVT01078426.1~~GHVT01078426.1.p1  ORF type:complete len:117 (-),score=4.46 GHVT01078426.1:995-1345(-)